MRRAQVKLVNEEIATESINFQSTRFFEELTACFKHLRDMSDKELETQEADTLISKIVKHYTGLTINLVIGMIGPCVNVPDTDKNNILITSFYKDYLSSADGKRRIEDAGGIVKGTVNIKTGKVTGVWTDYVSDVYYPLELLRSKKYDPEESAAILLHELGHVFTYFEFMTRSVTTNQVLAEMSKALDGSVGSDQREAVLLSVKKALHLSDLDEKELAVKNNTKIAEIVVITNVVKETVSELGSNVYDMTTCEMLADQYAARNGAGRYAVTGLSKLYEGSGHISFRSTPAYLWMEALKVALIAAAPFTLGLTLIIAMSMIGADSLAVTTGYIYDTVDIRFKKIRNQIVYGLKDKSLLPGDSERMLADLDAIDAVLKTVNSKRQWFGVLSDFVNPTSRNYRNTVMLQNELEAIAVSDLYVKAAELRQLSK
jgi:hypothetical protein